MANSKLHYVHMILVVDEVGPDELIASFDPHYRVKGKPMRYVVTGGGTTIKKTLVTYIRAHGGKRGRLNRKQFKQFIKENSTSFAFTKEAATRTSKT